MLTPMRGSVFSTGSRAVLCGGSRASDCGGKNPCILSHGTAWFDGKEIPCHTHAHWHAFSSEAEPSRESALKASWDVSVSFVVSLLLSSAAYFLPAWRRHFAFDVTETVERDNARERERE